MIAPGRLLGAEYPTPLGPVSVVASPEDGVVLAASTDSLSHLVARLPSNLASRGVDPGEVPSVSRAISAWVAGDASDLGRIPVRQEGAPFTQRVWSAMREIPAGATMTYGELAAAAGSPRAARAVGRACATNRVALFVPCHRVVSAAGLGNYGFGGPELKARMLGIEGAKVEAPQRSGG